MAREKHANRVFIAKAEDLLDTWAKTHPGRPQPLYCITRLDLSSTGLFCLPKQGLLGSLPGLTYLDLRNNAIVSLGKGLIGCTHLMHLRLDRNKITSLRGELTSLHCLQTLEAANNNLQQLKVGKYRKCIEQKLKSV